MKTYLCLDIGGSKYVVGLIDREGNLLDSRKGGWPALTRDAVLDTLLAEARDLLARTGAKPEAVGITIPGLADPARGLWVEASFSGIRDFAICDEVTKALSLPASTVILCQSTLAEKYRDCSAETCLIATPCEAYRAARLLYQAIPVSRIAETDELVTFHLDDYLDDVRETVLQSRHRSYPVLDENGRVVGALSRYHLLRPRRKRVVLVDHNEVGQSVPGLEQAELIGIIDHHRLGDVMTGYPVFMRNEPVGSATTIVATMYQEQA